MPVGAAGIGQGEEARLTNGEFAREHSQNTSSRTPSPGPTKGRPEDRLRHQAEALAAAGGRKLGEARQILQLNRAVQGDQAVVTVAARFGFAP